MVFTFFTHEVIQLVSCCELNVEFPYLGINLISVIYD